jgi:hypothetical protein
MATKREATKETTHSIKRLIRKRLTLRIQGTSPLVMHRFTEKTRHYMDQVRQEGRKTRDREIIDPEAQATACTYYNAEGKVCMPAAAFRKCLHAAAHKKIGIEKTLIRSLFVVSPEGLVPIETDEGKRVVRTDIVRNKDGTPDVRYRPQFTEWGATLTFEFDASNIRSEDVLNLIDRAGFGVGIGESRPEKMGDWGRFELDSTFQPQEVTL